MTEGVANTISTSLSANNLWSEVGTILPIVLPLILFGFGFFIVKKVLNTTRNGKPRI